MSTMIKWTFTSMVFAVMVLGVVYASAIQNLSIQTTAKIEVVADTLSAGIIRGEITEDGQVDNRFVNKEELIANLTSKVISVQKSNKYDLQLDYLFFDKNGNVTENEHDIRSIQFRVQFVNEDGDIKGQAERHLEINITDPTSE